MNLEENLRALLEALGPVEPLPTMRRLGERFGVSHMTVSRTLAKMAADGSLWKAASGRYYRAGAEQILTPRRPVGCLVRSLSNWAFWYEGIMSGVGQACEAEGRSILLHPVADFVQQSGPGEPAHFLSEADQRDVLGRYLDQHPKASERLLLDDCWSDAVLRAEADRLRLACRLLRPAPVAGMQSCHPNFEQGAFLGLSHLLDCGYRDIRFIQPYSDYVTPGLLESAFEKAFQALGGKGARFEVLRGDGAARFSEWAAAARRLPKGRKIAFVCPEDNFTIVFLRALREAGVSVPDQVGLLGAMGTRLLADAGISRLKIDFVALGRRAVAGPFSEDGNAVLDFTLEKDQTTGA